MATILNYLRQFLDIIGPYRWWIFAVLFLFLIGAKYSKSNDRSRNLRKELTDPILKALTQIFNNVGKVLEEYSENNWSPIYSPETTENAGSTDSVPPSSIITQRTESDGAPQQARDVNTQDVIQSIRKIVKRISKSVDPFLENAKLHANRAIALVRRDSEYGDWNVAGAVICLFLLLVFLYADTNLALQTFSIGPDGDKLGEIKWMQNLSISIITSSLGTSFTLAFIAVDAMGVTHFIPWGWNRKKRKWSLKWPWRYGTNNSTPPHQAESESNLEESNLEDGFVKNKGTLNFWVITFSTLTFLFNLVLVTVIALFRLTVLIGEFLPDDYLVYLKVYFNLAQSLTIVPLFLTTFLLFWGVMGLIVLYYVFIQVLLLAMLGVKGVLFLIDALFSLLGPATALVAQLLLAAFAFTFTLLGLILGLTLQMANSVSEIIENAIQTLAMIFSLFLEIPAKLMNMLRKKVQPVRIQ